MKVTIKEVVTKKELKAFVHFPNEFYKDNAFYVPTLESGDRDALDPVVTYGRYKPGKAVFANVFRTKDDFAMLIAPVEMQDAREDRFTGVVRGWMKPEMPIARFLEKISEAGVTHHSSLIYGARPEEVAFFAKLVGLETVIL